MPEPNAPKNPYSIPDWLALPVEVREGYTGELRQRRFVMAADLLDAIEEFERYARSLIQGYEQELSQARLEAIRGRS